MNNLSKEKQTQLAMVGVVCLAVIAGIWYGVISLQLKSIQAIEKQIVENKSRLEIALKIMKNKDNVEKDLLSHTEMLLKIEQEMVSTNSDMYGWMINKLQPYTRLGSPYKVNFTSVSSPTVGDAELFPPSYPYKAARFIIKGSGYFHDFGRFVAEFENAFPYTRITNVDLLPAGAGGGSGVGGGVQPASAGGEDREKLDIKLEIVTLVRPKSQEPK